MRRSLLFLALTLIACSTPKYAGLGEDEQDSGAEDAQAADGTTTTDEGILPDGSKDSASDGTAEATSDSTSDVETDAAPESAPDDATAEVAAADDATGDVASDEGVDAPSEDGTTDAGAESATDAGSEASLDTGVASDAASPDAGPPPLLSSNPGRVYCEAGGKGDALCPGGQVCCGTKPLVGGTWAWTCGKSCGAALGSISRTYECNEKADCGGNWCCVLPGFGGVTGTQCAAPFIGCAGGDIACMTSADCPSGKSCKATRAADGAFSIGVCG